jgi:hypothetical protein
MAELAHEQIPQLRQTVEMLGRELAELEGRLRDKAIAPQKLERARWGKNRRAKKTGVRCPNL